MKNFLFMTLLSIIPILFAMPLVANTNPSYESQLWQTYNSFGHDTFLEATTEVKHHEVKIGDSDRTVYVKIQIAPASVEIENGTAGYAKIEFTSSTDPHTNPVTNRENYERKFTIYAGYVQTLTNYSFSSLDVLGLNIETRVLNDKQYNFDGMNIFNLVYKRLIHDGVIPGTSIPLLFYTGGEISLSHLSVVEKDRPEFDGPFRREFEDFGGIFVNVAACAGLQSNFKGFQLLLNACAKAEENLTLGSFDSTSKDYDLVLRKNLSKTKVIDLGYKYKNHQDEGSNEDSKSGSLFFNFKF